MKRILVLGLSLLTAFAANAQDSPFEPMKDRQFMFDILNICGIMAVIYLLSSFILQITRYSLEHKLKNRILDKGPAEGLVAELLKPTPRRDPAGIALQWCCVLGGIGLGFVVMRLFPPYGLHSLALMAFCVAAGFGIYYYFSKRTRP